MFERLRVEGKTEAVDKGRNSKWKEGDRPIEDAGFYSSDIDYRD